MVRAVFLDRDGVIVIPEFRDGRSFAPRRIEDFAIYPEANGCLVRLKAAGFRIIVVTNQPDVGAGLVAREVIEAMHHEMSAKLPIDSTKACFHTQDDRCDCRKPNSRMLFDSAEEFDIDLQHSFMVGDRKGDIEAGAGAGCKTVFIDHGYTSEEKPKNADFFVKSLSEATNWILGNRLP